MIYTICDSPGKVIYSNSLKFPGKYVVVTRKKIYMMLHVKKDGSYDPLIKVANNLEDAINYLNS